MWRLAVFAPNYEALGVYRDDMIMPFGIVWMVIQGAIFSVAYRKFFGGGSVLGSGLKFGFVAGLLSWRFTNLAVAAKHVIALVPDYLLLETGITVVQFAVVGPLMALALALAWRGAGARSRYRPEPA